MGLRTRRFVGAVVLAALAGLPVTASVCPALCETTGASASRHAAEMSMAGQTAACHETVAATDQRITAGSRHDCRPHDGTARDAEAALTSARSDSIAPLVTNTPAFAVVALASPMSHQAHAGYGPPTRTSPPHSRLVLRV